MPTKEELITSLQNVICSMHESGLTGQWDGLVQAAWDRHKASLDLVEGRITPDEWRVIYGK